MKKIYKPQNPVVTSISSDEIIYQGDNIKCILDTCENNTITGVINSIGNISCYSYDELNSLSNINLGCYSTQIGCDDKNLLNLFNFAFSKLCEIENKIVGLETSTPNKIIMDFCTAINYTCSDPCLFPVPCCSADEGQYLNDIIQAIIGRVIRHSNQICTINTTLIDLQDQIDEIETGTGGDYTPPKITLTCGSYWDGTAYIPTPLVQLELDEAIEFLDVDLCQVKKTVGRYDSFVTCKNKQFLDPITGDPIYDYTATQNIIGYACLMQDYLYSLKLQVNAIQSKLDECCRTDCDNCMDNFFDRIETNYGQVAAGATGTPIIDLNHNINTQALPSCLGNAIDLTKSSYYITDGITTKVMTLDQLEGVTVLSGSISGTARLRFNLADLGLDYLRDIIIKLKVVTVLGCIDNYRELIQRFDSPVCDLCMFCIKKLDDSDTDVYTATFNINFSGGAFANETRTYTLVTTNPCISIEKKPGQQVTISNMQNPNPDKALVYSDCPEFGLPEPCAVGGSGATELSCWFFPTPTVESLAPAFAQYYQLFGDFTNPNYQFNADFNIWADTNRIGFIYKGLTTLPSVPSEVLTGDVYTYNNLYTDSIQTIPLVPTTSSVKVRDSKSCGTVTTGWTAPANGLYQTDQPTTGGVVPAGGLINQADLTYSKDGRYGIILQLVGQPAAVAPLIEIETKGLLKTSVYIKGELIGNCNC